MSSQGTLQDNRLRLCTKIYDQSYRWIEASYSFHQTRLSVSSLQQKMQFPLDAKLSSKILVMERGVVSQRKESVCVWPQ